VLTIHFFVVNVVFTILALQYIRPVHYSIFQPCIPGVATIISVLYGIEKFTFLKTCGILCAISGAIISKYDPTLSDVTIATELQDGGTRDVAFGTLLVVVQVCCMGFLLVLQKTLLNRYDSTVLTFSYYGVATVITIGVSIVAVSTSDSESSVSSVMQLLNFGGRTSPWFALLYAALSTFYTNNAYAWAGKQVSPSVTAIYNTFQPVFTALLSVLFLSEVLSPYELAGSALVILGMVVTLYGRSVETTKDSNSSKKKKS
jgi:drug/metabolite transporter (DMT)-like permease